MELGLESSLLTSLILSNKKPDKKRESESTGNGIKNKQTHIFCVLTVLLLIVADTIKNKTVAAVPIRKVSQESGLLAPGTKAPMTTEPKIILAPSKKNSANVRK